MADETVYSSDPMLRSPRRFAAEAVSDLRLVRGTSWRLFVRGTQARYRKSRLGYFWLVVPTFATALTWVYLDHAGLVRFSEPGVPYLAYVLAGTLLWQVFSDALQAPLRQLSSSRNVLTKTRLPHESWLVAALLEVLLGFALRLAVLAVVLVVLDTGLRWELLLVPLSALALVALGFAIGLALVPLGLLYDDVGQTLLIVTSLWFFLTPVVYPWPRSGTGSTIVELNPVTPLLVTTRAWLAGAPGAAPGHCAIVGACSLVLLMAAWVAYRLSRPHLVSHL